MIRRALVKVQRDEEGKFIQFPPDLDIDLSDAIWIIEDDKYFIHLDGSSYRRKIWFDTFSKLEQEVGRLPYEDWKAFCRLIRKPND